MTRAFVSGWMVCAGGVRVGCVCVCALALGLVMSVRYLMALMGGVGVRVRWRVSSKSFETVCSVVSRKIFIV